MRGYLIPCATAIGIYLSFCDVSRHCESMPWAGEGRRKEKYACSTVVGLSPWQGEKHSDYGTRYTVAGRRKGDPSRENLRDGPDNMLR